MATYNGAAYLETQLDSILSQTVLPLEILIGDDGSTDGTLEVIDRVGARTDIPIMVTRNEQRLGYAENFLRTAGRATGRLIAFADQDDTWLPDKLAAAIDALSVQDVMLWVSGWSIVNSGLEPLQARRLRTGFIQQSALGYPLHVPHGTRLVFKSELLEYFAPETRCRSVYGDRPAHHDEWVFFAAKTLGRARFDPHVRTLYRRHDESVSGVEAQVRSRLAQLATGGDSPVDEAPAAAAARGEYLAARAEDPGCASVRISLLEAAAYYRHLIPRLQRRLRTRTASGRRRRCASLGSALARADYRSLSSGGLGVWMLIQDAYSALAERPREAPPDA